MKRATQQFWVVLACVLLAAGGVLGIITLLKDNVVFFYTPKDIAEGKGRDAMLIRAGGYVVPGSIEKATDSLKLSFMLEAEQHQLHVHFEGMPPPMFRATQGIVAEGTLEACDATSTCLKATRLLTKHDENYKPPELPDNQ